MRHNDDFDVVDIVCCISMLAFALSVMALSLSAVYYVVRMVG